MRLNRKMRGHFINPSSLLENSYSKIWYEPLPSSFEEKVKKKRIENSNCSVISPQYNSNGKTVFVYSLVYFFKKWPINKQHFGNITPDKWCVTVYHYF